MTMTGEERRDDGIELVLANSGTWKDMALAMIADLPPGWIGTGEDIRVYVDEKPHHPNAWGGLINAAIRRGYIEPTGEYTKMEDPNSHARKTPVYCRKGDGAQLLSMSMFLNKSDLEAARASA